MRKKISTIYQKSSSSESFSVSHFEEALRQEINRLSERNSNQYRHAELSSASNMRN
ncbi:hypothetical protein [Christiangramia fulva]|uniref:hypothetical protein n=1 Tax=Christiangramia fulva TaxID=2126553 RepID=UPI00131E8315|nr:hypothetical protein [Christiangramia fulva]